MTQTVSVVRNSHPGNSPLSVVDGNSRLRIIRKENSSMGLLERTVLACREYMIVRDEARFRKEFYKKARLSYPPRSVTIAISSACTNQCIFCAYHSDDARNARSKAYGLDFRLSFKDFKRIVDMCYRGRVPNVHLCATGEPFLHTEIFKMLDYSTEICGSTSIQTNFNRNLFESKSLISEILLRQDSIKKITTDFLSGKPSVHNHIKKGSKYEDVMSAMEYINQNSNIHFEVHYVLTRLNYAHLDDLINDLARRKINCHVAIVNLHPYGFNEFTSPESVYMSKDLEISKALQAAKALGQEKGIEVSIPSPFDSGTGMCGSFWTRIQTKPIMGVDRKRYAENVIVGACNAVVIGNLKTLGYIFDYDNIMDLWNNEYFVRIRGNLLKGIYPDEACTTCRSYKSARAENRRIIAT